LRVIVDTKPAVELVERALASGASPDDRDALGRSPLFIAVSKGYLDLVELLYAAGADPFARDVAGETPASLALASGEDAIRAMFGKDPDAADYLGETALHHAAAAGLTKAAQSLLALGADTALANAAGETAAEVETLMADCVAQGVDILTIGQYLQPTPAHHPVVRYWEPAEFRELARVGRALGLPWVEAGPLVRSSYHAREQADGLGAAGPA
jgi:hypothetical protein